MPKRGGLVPKDADVLICLCVDVQEDIDGTAEAEYMCGSIDAGKMANEAGAKKLVLVHHGNNLGKTGNTERAIRDIAREYDGPIVWGEEMMAFDA